MPVLGARAPAAIDDERRDMTLPVPGPDPAVERRMALAREWDELVERVRKLDGFADFLQPPTVDALLPAAEHGPVAMVNISRWRCDALIVRPTDVTTVPLHSLSFNEAVEKASGYLAALQAAEGAEIERLRAREPLPGDSPRTAARRRLTADRAAEQAQGRVNAMLCSLQEWMWDTIAGPVLDELGHTGVPEGDPTGWPRIWWCPTGPLTLLPLHTAGHHHAAIAGESPPRTVLDRAVSSYTPTLRALLESRRPDEEQDHEQNRLLLVDVPDPPGQPSLDTTAERAALQDAFPEPRRTVLDHDAATRNAVRAALRTHRWVHFSCHGDQDLDDPSRGGLLLGDGVLTVADIAEARHQGEFAGVSACKTAVGGIELLDEAVTLASALHYTGFRHVVAALWSVDNRTSAEVFTGLYRAIAEGGRIAPERAAAALHVLVRRLRDRHPDWPHRWTPFAHTGP